MSDLFYNVLWHIGRSAFWVSSSPVVVNAHHTDRLGAFIIAANHQCPYDIPLLMCHSARNLDFVSIVEVFRNPFVAWLYGSMNAFPLDRSKPDSPTVRIILDRLRRGRVIAMFPEGGFRRGKDSVVHGGRILPGIGRIAARAGVPVVPCVLINPQAYSRVTSWLPLRRTRYGVMFGPPMSVAKDGGSDAPKRFEDQLKQAFITIHEELESRMGIKA